MAWCPLYFCIHLAKERNIGCIAIIVFLLQFYGIVQFFFLVVVNILPMIVTFSGLTYLFLIHTEVMGHLSHCVQGRPRLDSLGMNTIKSNDLQCIQCVTESYALSGAQ